MPLPSNTPDRSILLDLGLGIGGRGRSHIEVDDIHNFQALFEQNLSPIVRSLAFLVPPCAGPAALFDVNHGLLS